MERIFPEWAESKPHTWAHHVERYIFAMRYCTGKTVLDLGCGAGYGLNMLLEVAQTVVGLDINAEAVLYARDKLAKYPRSYLVIGDAHWLGFKDGSFDIVIAFEVIEHLEDPVRALREIWRVLKEGGLFLASSPRRDLLRRRPTNPYHKVEFSLGEFQGILREVFREVELFGQYYDWMWTELLPPGVGLRRVARAVAWSLSHLLGISKARKKYNVMPIRQFPRHFVPRYMVAICRKVTG